MARFHSFTFNATYRSIVYLYHIFFIHLKVSGHLVIRISPEMFIICLHRNWMYRAYEEVNLSQHLRLKKKAFCTLKCWNSLFYPKSYCRINQPDKCLILGLLWGAHVDSLRWLTSSYPRTIVWAGHLDMVNGRLGVLNNPLLLCPPLSVLTLWISTSLLISAISTRHTGRC